MVITIPNPADANNFACLKVTGHYRRGCGKEGAVSIIRPPANPRRWYRLRQDH